MTEMSAFAKTIMQDKYSHTLADGRKETWEEIAHRVATSVMGAVKTPEGLVARIEKAIVERKFIPGGRYLYASGRPLHQTQNCLLLKAEDSREGWGDLMRKSTLALMSGAGIGVVYSEIRPYGTKISRTGGTASGPLSLAKMVNESGRYIRQGGDRRSAIWGGLHWWHDDIDKWIHAKNWSDGVKALKAKDYNASADLDGTNISVILDDDFFANYNDPKAMNHAKAQDVYWKVVRQMLETAEPGFTVDCGENSNENLRNACCEVSSYDDSDICNLGSINMAKITSPQEMTEIVDLAMAFLLAGTVYSDVPYAEVDRIRNANRRLGLGLMGLHEWLLTHGKKYGPDSELERYLKIYQGSGAIADHYAQGWGLNCPVKTRAIAPTGTTSIVAESSSGIEPLFCVSWRRRYIKDDKLAYQYVVDPVAQRLIESGVPVDQIEDAYALSENVERRVEFQAWVQQFVDQCISSTVNLPPWGSERNNESTVKPFGEMLMKYLPRLRGITVYPDGARSSQPLTPVRYQTAVRHLGEVFFEGVDVCEVSRGSSCG